MNELSPVYWIAMGIPMFPQMLRAYVKAELPLDVRVQ